LLFIIVVKQIGECFVSSNRCLTSGRIVRSERYQVIASDATVNAGIFWQGRINICSTSWDCHTRGVSEKW